MVRRVTRLETRLRVEPDEEPFAFNLDALNADELRVIQDAQAFLAREGVAPDGVLPWETLTASERALCTRAADIILKYRRDAEDGHPRMH